MCEDSVAVPFLPEIVVLPVHRCLPNSCEAHAGKQCEYSPRNIAVPGHRTTY